MMNRRALVATLIPALLLAAAGCKSKWKHVKVAPSAAPTSPTDAPPAESTAVTTPSGQTTTTEAPLTAGAPPPPGPGQSVDPNYVQSGLDDGMPEKVAGKGLPEAPHGVKPPAPSADATPPKTMQPGQRLSPQMVGALLQSNDVPRQVKEALLKNPVMPTIADTVRIMGGPPKQPPTPPEIAPAE